MLPVRRVLANFVCHSFKQRPLAVCALHNALTLGCCASVYCVEKKTVFSLVDCVIGSLAAKVQTRT